METFNSVLDHLLEGFQLIDPEWRYVYVNDAVAKQGRKPKERLLGRTMMEVYPGIEETAMFSVLKRCMEERVADEMENEFVFPDGSCGWFELRFQPVPEGVFIVSLDVTERKLAAARIEHLNAVLQGIRNVNQLITREADRDTLLQSACDLLVEARGFSAVVIGLTDSEGATLESYASAGDGLFDLRAKLERHDLPAWIRRAIDTRSIVLREGRKAVGAPTAREVGPLGGTETVTVPVAHHDRTYGFMAVRLPHAMVDDPEEHSLLLEASGDVAFALRSIEINQERVRALEELRATEQQLRQAQKLEAIGHLAGGVAHDFNNILMAQMGHCEMMRRLLRDADPLRTDLDQIEACAQRAASLTRQLLAFSRKQALQLRPLNLNQVVSEMERMLRRLIGEDVDFTTELEPELGAVMADPSQIEQIVANLVVNARDAMPSGGSLTIETRNVELDDDYLRQHIGSSAGPHALLAISDTGCGMDEAIKARLFEPFFTTKDRSRGTGLGLATVYGIVKQSGGNIWVYSEQGQATTFKIYLPVVDATPEVAHTAASSRPVRGQGESVLVVEDDEVLRTLIAKMLESLDYRVTVASNGEDAIAAFGKMQPPPHLVLTDIVMPRMDGRALVQELKRLRPEIKVLYTSGFTDHAVVRSGGLDPEIPLLTKPFRLAELASELRGLLDEPR